mgnify:CR=1 FL=1
MAHHKSTIKRILTSEKARLVNRHNRSTMRTALKNFQTTLDKDATEASKALPEIMKVVNKSAKKGAIKKATASRKISRLAKAVHKALQNT